MSTAVADARWVTYPPVRSQGGIYVHPDMLQQVYFRIASNSFQASGESVRRTDISNSSNEAAKAIPKGIYLHENQLKYYDLHAPEINSKRLNHHNLMQQQASEYLKQSTAVKECSLTSEQVRRGSSTDEIHLHNNPPSGIQKIVRVENFPDYLVCLPNNGCPATEARRSTMQFESRQQVQIERYRARQNAHHLHETECLPEKRVIYLKPKGCQTETMSVPMTMGNPLQLSNTTQFRPKYPANVQNPRVSTSAPVPKHLSHRSWPNPASVAHEEFPSEFPRQGNNGRLSEVPPQDSVHFHSPASPYSVSHPESHVNSVQRQAPSLVASNTVQPNVLFVRPEGPTVLNYSSGRNHPPTPQMAPDIPSASTYRIASSDTYNPGGKLLSNRDSNVAKCNGHCETPKYDSAALPVHPIPTNTVPTDAHLLTYPPARQFPIYRREEPYCIENRSKKAHCFPFRIVYVPSDGASCVTAPRPCQTRDVSCQACPTEDYTTRDFRQPVSNHFQTSERLQHTTRAPSSFEPSQVNGSEGHAKVPIQYSCQTAPEGFCRPMGRGCSAPDHRTDLMSCVHHKAPSYSKSNATMTAPTDRLKCAAQPVSRSASAHGITTCNPHFESLNGYVPSESNNISRSENSAFHKVICYRDAEKAQHSPHLEVNPWIVPNKQQQHDINSEDSFDPSHGRRRSRWSDNISSRTSPHIRGEDPTVSLHDTPVNENLLAAKEPRCYISVDSKPQVDKEKEQSNISNTPRRFHEIMRPHEERMPFNEQEQPESKLEKLTKFVVGVESKIQWNKVGAYEKSKPKTSEVKDLQIVSISSTHSPRYDSTTPSNSSGSESEDPLCMIRLERVYYSTGAMPSRHLSQSSANPEKHGSKVADCNVDSEVRKYSSLPSETRQTISNGEHSSKQINLAPFGNKAEKCLSADTSIHKTSHGSADGPVKRKANVSSAMIDGNFGVKRKKMMKTKSTVPPKGTVITAFRKVETSLEIRSTKNLTVRLEDGKPEYKSGKKETSSICERILKRCGRKARINS